VLAHRLLLSPEAQMRGATVEDVLASLLEGLPVPMREQA
jgi:MoxR-like ATPase